MSEFRPDDLFDPSPGGPPSGPHGRAELMTQANKAIQHTQRWIVDNEEGKGPLLTREEAERMIDDLRQELIALIDHRDR